MGWLGSAVLAAALVAVVGWPLVAIALQALGEPASGVRVEVARPLELAGESLKLVGLTEAIALPIGVGLAWLLFRTDLPGRRALLGLVALTLFVPLPLQALAWLGSFGNLGRSQALGTSPILVGRFGAAWVHAMAALPWVVLVSGVGLRAVEPELEESALLDLPGWRVAFVVTLRRALGAIAGAALAVAVLTAGEMTVTDLIPLRTYAEEAYTLGQEGLSQGRLAVRATWPQLVVIALMVVIVGRGLLRMDPSRVASSASRARTWPLGRWRRPVGLGAWLGVAGLLALPIYGLVWRAGRVGEGLVAGRGASWSLSGLGGTLRRAWGDLASADLSRLTLFETLLCAGIGASLTVAIAWPLAWKARGPGVWRWVAAGVVALLLAVPGPIAGLALKIAAVDLQAVRPGPGGSAVLAWTLQAVHLTGRLLNRTAGLMVVGYVVRTLPYALLILWPACRAIPREFLDAAAVDGLGPWRRAWRVGVPLTMRAIAAAWGLAFALAIGELPTTYVVRAPGRDPVSIYVWGLLHVGVESRLAGAGLILLGLVAGVGVLAVLVGRWGRMADNK